VLRGHGPRTITAGTSTAAGRGFAAPSDVADQLAGLRIAAGEVDALAAVTVGWFDDGDWAAADPVLVERLASLLGLVARGATAMIAAVERFHGVVADAMPASERDRWDDDREVPEADAVAYRSDIVRRMRARCAAAHDLPADYPFFERWYREGETPDEALFRIFEAEKQAMGSDDDELLAALARQPGAALAFRLRAPHEVTHSRPT
jgi:hypothetical protein